MAEVILGAAGAAIGSAFGNPALGWAIGTTLAGVLFPPSLAAQEFGKLDDAARRVSGSAYGTVIPQVFGKARVGGNIVWATDLEEIASAVRSGGKGSRRKTSKQYTYRADVAVAFCRGPKRIKRIWAEDRIVFDGAASPNSRHTVRIYDGDEAQLKDTLISAIKGATLTPAYRGVCYALFEDFELAQWGNRIPLMNAEVDDVPVGPTTADMLWHFKADAIPAQSDNSNLTAWPDSAPVPHNMQSPGTNGGSNIKYRTAGSAANINGLPVVNSPSGSQADIPWPNFSPVVNDASFTHYYVGRYNNVQSGHGILMYNYTTAGADVIRLAISSDLASPTNGVGYEYDVGGGPVAVTPAAGANAVQLITFVFDKSAGVMRVYRDGTQIGTSTNVGGTGAGNGFDWGNDFIEFFACCGGVSNLVGDHGELVGYKVAHDDTARAGVESYLKTKWGIP